MAIDVDTNAIVSGLETSKQAMEGAADFGLKTAEKFDRIYRIAFRRFTATKCP